MLLLQLLGHDRDMLRQHSCCQHSFDPMSTQHSFEARMHVRDIAVDRGSRMRGYKNIMCCALSKAMRLFKSWEQ